MCPTLILVCAALLALHPAASAAECDRKDCTKGQNHLAETFESAQGTDNPFEALVEPGNLLDPDFWNVYGLPQLWGRKSGRVIVGPDHGTALWMRRDEHESPTGYHFTASLLVAIDGVTEGKAITLFISKPADWSGSLACWRLYFHKLDGVLSLVLVLGLNTATNNKSAASYMVPISTNEAYDVSVTYDTWRRFYLWSVNGRVLAAARMPADYPLIGTKIIGSSGSSDGRNSVFVVDNVRWYELPK